MIDVQYTPEGIERLAQALAVADTARPAGTPWETVKEHYTTMVVRALQEMAKIHNELMYGTHGVSPLTLEESNDYTARPHYQPKSLSLPSGLYDAVEALSAKPSKFKEGDNVRKSKGYKFPGNVRSVYTTLEGETRYVVQLVCEGVGGLQHIFNEDQLERAD